MTSSAPADPSAPVLLVRRRTELERLHTLGASGILARLAPEERERLHRAHREHTATCEAVLATLRSLSVPWREEREPTEAMARASRLVLTLGGDGTLLRTSHAVPPGVPVLAINTSPSTSVGHFATAAGAEEAARAVTEALRGEIPSLSLARMSVRIDDETVTRRVLNDVLFSHACPASTSRYRIVLGSETADHRSSGVWIGPPAGSTAAIRSAGGEELPLDAKRIQFVVREPYAPPGYALPPLCRGLLAPEETLWIRSRMEEGMLYVDGAHRRIPAPYGCTIALCLSEEPLELLRRR